MPFPRSILFEACNFLGRAVGYHGEFEDMVLRWELAQFEACDGQAVHQRFRRLFQFLRDHPNARHDGRLISDLVVEEAVRWVSVNRPGGEFVHALEQAGYEIEDGHLRRALPDALDLPAADDEVHILLNRYNLVTPRASRSVHRSTYHARRLGRAEVFLNRYSMKLPICWLRIPQGARTRVKRVGRHSPNYDRPSFIPL